MTEVTGMVMIDAQHVKNLLRVAYWANELYHQHQELMMEPFMMAYPALPAAIETTLALNRFGRDSMFSVPVLDINGKSMALCAQKE